MRVEISVLKGPISDEDLPGIKEFCMSHLINLEKLQSGDSWWVLYLPEGSIYEEDTMSVLLPDKSRLLYKKGIHSKLKGNWLIEPLIALVPKELEEE